MSVLRRHLLQHRAAGGLVLLAALLMRMLVPAGFMPAIDRGTITIILCTGTGPQTVQMAMPGMAMSGSEHDRNREHQDKSGAPCIFSGLLAPALSGADALLLAVAILFVMALGVRTPARRPVPSPTWLRPPLRGPPLLSW